MTAAKLGKPNSPYYLGGGGFGGPIVKDRTFFWVSNEQYHDVQTRNSAARLPTAAERAGDFSGLTNAAGQQVDDLRPADPSAVPRQHHPGEPHQPGRGER